MLRSLLSSSTGASITTTSPTSRVVMMRAAAGGAFTSTTSLLQKDVVFETTYRNEAFRAQQRLKESKNYPGPTRAATPGEAAYCYNGTQRLASEPSERNYWRPVVDDAPTKVLDYVTVRVQFKGNVWVSAGWEVRMHVIQVSVPRNTTLKELKSRVVLDNKHPYLCQTDFQLCDADSKPFGSSSDKDGIDMTCTLEGLGVHDHTVVQAVEVDEDHLLHTHARNGKFKSWHEDDLSVGELNDTTKPYRDLGYPTEPDGKPRMEAKPSALFNYGNLNTEMHGGASWGVNAPTPAQLARLKIMRSAMTSSLSTTIARSMCHPTWKGDYPVLGAEWVPFERTQCIIAALENGILVVHNVVSNTRVPLFTPFDIRTFSSSTSSSRGRAVAGGAHAESSTPRPGQTVAASLKYGSINAVAVAAQKPNQLIASDHSMVMAWNYQDHIATCCIDAGRREPVPTGLSKIAAIPSGLTPEDIHIKFSPYFYTSASTSMKKVCSRLLVCVVSESETASSRLMVCMQDEASCKAAVTSTSGTASSPSTTTGITANGASTSSPSATYPKFNTIIQPWKMIHGEVIHVQWISPTGPTSEATDVSVIHAHPPALLVGTSDGRLTILRITLPSTTTTTPISTTGNDDSVGAQVFSETVFVSSSAVSHLDVQMFSSTYNQQAAAHAERQKAAPKTTSPSLTVKCDYVLYFVALGNIVHNATISISWLDLFGVGDASPSSPSSASVAAQIGTKRARSEEGSEPTTTTDSAVVTSTTPSSAPQQQQKQLLTVFVTPLTSTCTDDAVVYGIQSALISSSFVLYCFVSSSVIALDGATLSTLFVTPFTRHRSGISTSSSTSGGAAGSSSSAASGALFSSALATRPIKLVPRDKPPFLGVVDGERFVLLRDGNSVSAASSTTTPVAVSAPSGGHHHGGTTHSGGSAGGGGYHNSHHGGGGGHHSGHHNSHHRR